MAISTSFCSLLMVMTILGHAAALNGSLLPQEVYWNTLLPKTPMPSVLHRLLHTGINNPYVLKDQFISQKSRKNVVWHMEGNWFVNPNKKSRVDTIWKDEGLEDNGDSNADDYILYKDLHPGTKMILHVLASTAHSGFLPRHAADSIPFSLSDLPKILTRFSVHTDSIEAKAIDTSLVVCDGLADDTGDRIHCITSLESMIDFAIAKIGTSNITATSTRAMGEISSGTKQTYTILAVRMEWDKGVVCHPMTYPYAVYYCHLIREPAAMAFKVLAAGEDGTVVDAVATCHMDTSQWNRNHLSALVLEKPGVPICHFLSKDNVIWAPR